MNQANTPQVDTPTAQPLAHTAVIEITHDGKILRLSPQDCPFSLGRAPDCGVTLRSAVASRKHGYIVWVSDRFFYVDDSLNGTYVLSSHGDELHLHRERLPLPRSGLLSPGLSVLDQTSEVVRFSQPRPKLAEAPSVTTRPFS